MLKLSRITIENFVCFEQLVIEPSTNSERRLTVIRAENASGKTTFLRAVRWGMYGEKGLPQPSTQFSLHPAWWQPNKEGITTTVSIEFETDGSTRHFEGGENHTNYYLKRSVTTIGKSATRRDDPNYRRINPRAQLMTKNRDGTWYPNNYGVDYVIQQLLPWGLRDFFIMDTDEVTDFVGGIENKEISRAEVIGKTTSAVRSLLGIEVFRDTSQRIEKIGREFGKQATRSIGDVDLNARQEELERLRIERDETKGKIKEQELERIELEDHLNNHQAEFENELKNIGAAEPLEQLFAKNKEKLLSRKQARKSTLDLLANEIESTDLLASLAGNKVLAAHKILDPLYEQGHIPLRHLYFVRGLIESGTCVCSQDISIDNRYRRHVEDRIKVSTEQEQRADYLAHVHDASKSLISYVNQPKWSDRIKQHISRLVALDGELSDLQMEEQDINNKLDQIDEQRLQVVRDEINALNTQIENINRALPTNEQALETLNDEIISLEKMIQQRQRNERVAADKRTAEKISKLIVRVLNSAYTTIQANQIRELSDKMDIIFAQMAGNVSEEDIINEQYTEALKMITRVGLRPLNNKADDYEIFALNNHGRSMPSIQINGASRRVMALSFVLALSIESKTDAPFIADSLLNFMSGTVRTNVLRITATTSSQPILLLTGSDLQSSSEAELVSRYAGATYTLTGQWDAIDAGKGGDVVNWTDQRLISLACTCGPRQYCRICERKGQKDLLGWARSTQREDS